MVKIKMLQSLIGEPPYRKGATYEVSEAVAKKWAAGGLCEIVSRPKKPTKKTSAK